MSHTRKRGDYGSPRQPRNKRNSRPVSFGSNDVSFYTSPPIDIEFVIEPVIGLGEPAGFRYNIQYR